MDAAIVEKQTADGWRVALDVDIRMAMVYITAEEIREVVDFAIREGAVEQTRRESARLQDIRDDYKQALRNYRSGDYFRVPEYLRDHCFDVQMHVADMNLPERFQYRPLTEALQIQRDENLSYSDLSW